MSGPEDEDVDPTAEKRRDEGDDEMAEEFAERDAEWRERCW